MMDRPLTIYTANGVFSDLVDYCHAEPKRCVSDGRMLWVDHLRFCPAGLNVDTQNQGSHDDDGRPATAWLDDDLDRLKTIAARGGRTLWYNPNSALAPDLLPVHDGEIVKMDDLAAIAAMLTKPTLKTCAEWMADWGLPVNIRSHVHLVARLAYGLGVMLRGQGQQVDPILAHRGGLLHDLDKLLTLDGTQRHGEPAAAFLRAQGHPDLAEIVRGHILGSVLEGQRDLRTWEAKLVFFCDKLVEQEQIVPFDERLRALKARYPEFREVMARAEPHVWALNDQICSILSIPSHENLISTLQELQNY
jgi:hypothetical protein